MENFILYDEIGHSDGTIIYKGRRKHTITFVAIHCAQKTKRAQITNLVRLSHEMQHTNVVKFFEWYETSNHLWLVLELCTSGTFDVVLSRDGSLPESSIRKYGLHLVRGLYYLHSLNVIFSDLRPSRIMVDGPGVLKYGDFGLARFEGEDLDELFKTYTGSGDFEDSERSTTDSNSTIGCINYAAPEVLKEKAFSMASDFWSLGCVLYEMYCGHPPFVDKDDTKLRRKIINDRLPELKLMGSRFGRSGGKASNEFTDLVTNLLHKKPEDRIEWAAMVKHNFWEGKLDELFELMQTTSFSGAHTLEGSDGTLTEKEADILRVVHSRTETLATARSDTELPQFGSVFGNVKTVDESGRSLDALTERNITMKSTMSTLNTDRPPTAPTSGDPIVATSRPRTVTPLPTIADDDNSPHIVLTDSPLEVANSLVGQKNTDLEYLDTSDITKLIYHTSDSTISPCVDNSKIAKPLSKIFDSKSLPIAPYSIEKLSVMNKENRCNHLTTLIDYVSAPEKGPASQKKLHVLNYLASLTVDSNISSFLLANGVAQILTKQIKETHHLDMKSRAARCLGLICHHASELLETTNVSDIVTNLAEIIRDNFRTLKIKSAILPALGELLYLIATQEDISKKSCPNWNVTSLVYTLISRCLRESDEAVVNHYAAKIIENVATTNGLHAKKFSTNEIALLLWYVYTHAIADVLKMTAISALCRLSRHQNTICQTVFEKAGFSNVLTTLNYPIPRIQQSLITMIACLLTNNSDSGGQQKQIRLVQEKDFLNHVMKLLESPSPVIRAKAFLVILESISIQNDLLIGACQLRLVMYMERDYRRGQRTNNQITDEHILSARDDHVHSTYLTLCLEHLIQFFVGLLPSLFKDILNAISAVAGRKHPSVTQNKQLKQFLPLISGINSLLSSQLFRLKIIDETFISNVGILLNHVRSIDCGTTSVFNAVGQQGSDNFLVTVFKITELLVSNGQIVADFYFVFIDSIIPPLVELVAASTNPDNQAFSLRLLSEIASILLNGDLFDTIKYKKDLDKIFYTIEQDLLQIYEQLLLDQDPIPSYALKLLLCLLQRNVAFSKRFSKANLSYQTFIQVIIDHKHNPLSSAIQNVLNVLICLVNQKDSPMLELYECGLIDSIITLFEDVFVLPDSLERHAVLQALIELTHVILKNVSEVVRKALQSKRDNVEGSLKETEAAERFLLNTKELTNTTCILTKLLLTEDMEIADITLKTLSLLVQLFAGEHPDAMNQEYMECYAIALKRSDLKKQKILLRIIKRMISTDKNHLESMKHHGRILTDYIHSLCDVASSQAEISLKSLACDILKIVGESQA